jgi:CRISPR-associated protein Csx10
MFKDSKIEFKLNIEDTFGKQGEEKSCPVYFSNLMIEDYEANKEWIKYLSNEYKEILSRDIIIDTFTEIRQQTAINEKTGVALPHSLRTIRVIKKGYKFYGDIQVEDEKVIDTLALACINLRRIGTKRNRGYGEVECKLFDGETEISIPEKVEELCKG